MSLRVQFFGATGEVTGSLYAIRAGSHTVVLECGLIQGNHDEEERNRDSLPFSVDEIDAVVLSHAHIDHSGRIPLLYKLGYRGPVFVHEATRALCGLMLPDAGYLNEKDAAYANRKRSRKEAHVQPLYTQEDAENCLELFETATYGEWTDGSSPTSHQGSMFVRMPKLRGPGLGALLFVLTSTTAASAQEPVPANLSLDEAVAIANRNNPTFQSTRNNEEVADWTIRAAYGSLIPSASASSQSSLVRSRSPKPTRPPSKVFGAKQWAAVSTTPFPT